MFYVLVFFFLFFFVLYFFFFFFFKQKTAYEISACLVGSEMCIRDSRQCERIEDVIARHFATSDFVCPRCHSPLTIVRRKGIIVGCTKYYDGCKTAFLLPMNANIIGRCKCGLPKLQLKTKIRCLDTK